ncbi:unnamed protein product [Pleuronectes platessa]|uniref:Uncharacterized protein n=1 Tax=Pleuronectes platessa TaxID=8262 RepID=A0A9N7Z7A7_PLEPL|nr:unnamed protein product [Pleuronectes platessa]
MTSSSERKLKKPRPLFAAQLEHLKKMTSDVRAAQKKAEEQLQIQWRQKSSLQDANYHLKQNLQDKEQDVTERVFFLLSKHSSDSKLSVSPYSQQVVLNIQSSSVRFPAVWFGANTESSKNNGECY